MKNILFLFVAVLFLSSCVIVEEGITYDRSNVALIHKSIKNLRTLENLQSNISKTDMIAIVGIENYKTHDASIYASLEDEIIKEFVTKGYKVLERDAHMVKRLVSESETKYRDLFPFGESGTVSGKGEGERRSSNSKDININVFDKTDGNASKRDSENRSSSRSHAETRFLDGYPTFLNSADKIISYRVIETGIIYNYDKEEAKVGEVEREARTILELRLTDAKSGEILNALTLDGQATDFIDKKDINALKEFSYTYYRQTLPLFYGIPEQSITYDKNNMKVLPWVAGGFGFLLLLIIIF
jgi:hypothetical protein